MPSQAELAMILRARDEGVKAVFDSTKGAADSWAKSINQSAGEVASTFKSGLGIGAGIAAFQTGLAAIGGTFGALKSSVIDFNQQLDQSRAVFARYFNGNTQLADQFLNTLKGFAASTPFEFKDLSSLAVRLQNANVSANDIIPTIKAIGNAASASGSLSKESLDRITLALTQMQMKGKVTGEEMLQLVENGVPAWQLLADATGKPIPVLQKLVSEGAIGADVLMKAFRDTYENAGLLEGASKSLEGALSTIRDVGTQAFADIGRSVYDLATQGANALAGFLSSQDFQTWIEAAKLGVDALVDGVRGLVSSLQPVGDVIAEAFHLFTSGDFRGAFDTVANAVQDALSGAVESIHSFGAQIFGAGANLINELAGGMIAGASQALTAALDTVTSTIAAFLIGQSPPPDGPLSKIREGGANAIDAWGEGAAAAADRAVTPAAEKIADNLGALKIAGRDAEASIRDIGRSIQDVESASRDLKYAADDIKTAYNDQIAVIDDQIKALQRAGDTQRDREKLELGLEEIQLRQAEIAAMGDRELRAQLQTRLEQLKAASAERKNQEALADAAREITGSEKERLKAKLDAEKLDQQERDLRERLGKAKPEERARIEQQLRELAIRRQIEAAEAKERQEAAQRRAADAQAKRDELALQSQISGLVDKEALAAIKARRDALALRKEDIGLAEQAERMHRELAIAPLKEQRDALVAQRDAMLKPLQDQLETLNRQKTALSEQRQEMQNYKAEVSAVAQGLRDQESAIKATAKAAKEAELNKSLPSVDKAFTADAATEAAIKRAKEAGERLATGLRDGFAGMFDRLVPQSIRAALAGIADRLSGEGVPGLINAIGEGLSRAVPVFASKLAAWYGVFLDWARENQSRTLAQLSEFQRAIRDWIGESAGAIGDTLYEWLLAFVNWATETGPELLDKMGGMAGDLLKWIGDEAKDIAGRLLDWGAAFIEWVGPKIPELLGELGELGARMVEWMGSHLGELLDALGKWAVEFVQWVGPKIPPLLEALGELLVKMTEWIIGTALPAIALKLLEWGKAIVDWVAPRIGPLLLELGKVLLAIDEWIIGTALPAIVTQLLEWGKAFVDWVPGAIVDLLAALAKLEIQLTGWIASKVISISKAALELGKGMLQGIQDGISGALEGFWSWLQTNFVEKIPTFVRELLGIHSPSGVFADIGRSIVDGLRVGMEQRLPAIDEIVSRMVGRISTAGEVTDWLRSAMQLTGVGGDWLAGLQRLVGWESSGDPRAVNPESVGGQHATGLLQTLPSTFRSYALPGMGDIFNPIHNAAAAIRYIMATYGHVNRIPGIRSGDHSQFPGYASGGIAWTPQLARVAEREPELIVPLSRLRGESPPPRAPQVMRVDVAVGGRLARQIVVEGYDLAVRSGWTPGGLTG